MRGLILGIALIFGGAMERRVALRYLGMLLAGAGALYAIWGLTAYSGLYRWLADVQKQIFGGYSLIFAFVMSLAISLVPGVFLMEWNKRLVPEFETFEEKELFLRRRSLQDGFGLLAAAALVACGCLAYRLTLPAKSDPVQKVDLLKLGDKEPPLGHIAFSAVADDSTLAWLEHLSSSKTEDSYYIELLPKYGAHPKHRIFTGHTVARADGGAAAMGRYWGNWHDGLLVKNGLPGEVVTVFEKTNVLKSGEEVYYLDQQGEGSRNTPTIAMIIAIVVGLILLGIMVFDHNRIRKLENELGTAA